jgi:chaperonin cofactor prefoldin
MTPEIWTIIGTGLTLSGLGTAGFTLLWRYIARTEERSEARFEARFADLKNDIKADLAAAEKRNEARFADLKNDIAAVNKRMDDFQTEIQSQMGQLRERMAKLEGLLEGLREAITGKRAA